MSRCSASALYIFMYIHRHKVLAPGQKKRRHEGDGRPWHVSIMTELIPMLLACMRCNNPVVISPVLSYTSSGYTMYSCNTQERRSRGDSHHLLTLFSLAAHIVAYIPTLYISRCLSLSLYLSSRAPSSLTNTKQLWASSSSYWGC